MKLSEKQKEWGCVVLIIRKLSSSQIIIAGFAAVILLGGFLLMLPFATRSGESTGFVEALFTATSAVCVTGLVVQDTASYWSGFGQTVILLLIQIGGMGVVTLTVAFSLLTGKKIGLKQRSTLQEAISAPKMGGIVHLTGFILRLTVCFEVLGAMLMAPVFCRMYGFWKGIWYACFHSISAFCNAGFDLMGIQEQYSSLTGFSDHTLINLVIMGLIVIGGIGFVTWDDIRTNRQHLHRYRMQSKVILLATGLLILLPAVYFFFFEFSEMPVKARILNSLFQSVTPRTAGFNTADLTRLSETGVGIIIILMLIGGSPGSTAGGMKTTTFAVMLATAATVFDRRENVRFFGRRVDQDTIRNAATILNMYLFLFVTGGFVISRIEGLPLLTCLFEAASAVGTVGLTLGITPELGIVSRLILIVLMYCGRVGGLTLVFAAVTGHQRNHSRFPLEKIAVG